MSFKLNEYSQRVSQPVELDVKLYQHQKASICAMIKFENNGGIKIAEPDSGSPLVKELLNRGDLSFRNIDEVMDNEYFLQTCTGILGDKAGSGKTYMLIGLIASQRIPKSHSRIIDGTKHFTLFMKRERCIRTNLVVVPHSLSRQWDHSLRNTNMKYIVIDNINNVEDFCDLEYDNKPLAVTNDTLHTARIRKGVKKTDNLYVRYRISSNKVRTICDYDIVVLNINQYKVFRKVFNRIKWARVIIDEMDTIHLPVDFAEYGNFNWFVTATPRAVFNRHRRYVSSIFGNLQWIIDYFMIKCDEHFISTSMGVPEIYTYFIKCMGNQIANQFQDVIPSNVMEMINAGNMREAVQHLNSNIETQESIITVIRRKFDRELHNLRSQIQYHIDLEYANQTAKEERIKSLQESIIKMESKIDGIISRVSNLGEKECSVCYDIPLTPAVCNLCQNVFCLQCLIMSLRTSGNKCPICRQILNSKKYTVIDKNAEEKIDDSAEDEQFSQIKKDDVLLRILDFILSDENSRIIICSNYAAAFDKIKQKIATLGIAADVISGSCGRVTNILNDFRSGEIRIILMDASHIASGLNIEFTTHIVMYNRFDKDLETQIIGRGHRIGRTTNLRIIYLTNETESQEIVVGKRKFNLEYVSDMDLIKDPRLDTSISSNLPVNYFAEYYKHPDVDEEEITIRRNWFLKKRKNGRNY